MKLNVFCAAGLGSVLLGLAGFASADPVYAFTDFGPGLSYNTVVSTGIGGPSQQTLGFEFTAVNTGILSQIELATEYLGGTNALDISLYQNKTTVSGDNLGSLMDSWTSGPTHPNPGSVVSAYNVNTSISVIAGDKYWVYVQGADASTYEGWMSAPGAAPSVWSVSNGVYGNRTEGAYAVVVTPEPFTMALGIAGVGMFLRRRRALRTA